MRTTVRCSAGTKKPSMYKVIMLNDDYTPMEFVIHVLELFFNMDQEKATQIILTVHTKVLPSAGFKDIAENKADMWLSTRKKISIL